MEYLYEQGWDMDDILYTYYSQVFVLRKDQVKCAYKKFIQAKATNMAFQNLKYEICTLFSEIPDTIFSISCFMYKDDVSRIITQWLKFPTCIKSKKMDDYELKECIRCKKVTYLSLTFLCHCPICYACANKQLCKDKHLSQCRYCGMRFDKIDFIERMSPLQVYLTSPMNAMTLGGVIAYKLYHKKQPLDIMFVILPLVPRNTLYSIQLEKWTEALK